MRMLQTLARNNPRSSELACVQAGICGHTQAVPATSVTALPRCWRTLPRSLVALEKRLPCRPERIVNKLLTIPHLQLSDHHGKPLWTITEQESFHKFRRHKKKIKAKLVCAVHVQLIVTLYKQAGINLDWKISNYFYKYFALFAESNTLTSQPEIIGRLKKMRQLLPH